MIENLYKYRIVLLALLLASCGRSEKTSSTESTESADQSNIVMITKRQFDESAMKLGALKKIDFEDEIHVNGMIDVPPQNRAVVSVPLGGYVTNTSLIIGDKVTKGQTLLTIQNPEFVKLQQEYLEVKEQLRYLEAEYNRHQKLYEENITSEKNYLRSESEYKTALARYTGLKSQLKLLYISPQQVESGNISTETKIYSPIGGSITKMNITTGAYISPATEILEIINTEHIHLELAVFEKDILDLKEGMPIEFSVPEASETIYHGRVYRIGTSIDENRRVIVHGHIDEDAESNFISGMFVDAAIIVNTSPQTALPETAVVEIGQRHYVLKLIDTTEDAYRFESVEVKVLDTDNGLVAISPAKTLDENDQFLTEGAFAVMGSF